MLRGIKETGWKELQKPEDKDICCEIYFPVRAKATCIRHCSMTTQWKLNYGSTNERDKVGEVVESPGLSPTQRTETWEQRRWAFTGKHTSTRFSLPNDQL